KTAIVAGTPNSGNWAAPLAPYDQVVAGFLEGLRNISALDAILPSMKRVPFRTRVSIVTTVPTASTPGAGEIKKISSIGLAGSALDERKAVSIVAISNELAKLSDSIDLITRALQTAVAASADADVIDILTRGIASTPSSGSTASPGFGRN